MRSSRCSRHNSRIGRLPKKRPKSRGYESAKVYENWRGSGQVGAFKSSGKNDEAGISLALNFARQGIAWRHRLRAAVDYKRSNGVTSREQYLLAYEPSVHLDDNIFAYSLAQVERNELQGFSGRYALSAGLGLDLVKSSTVDLAIKAGPAYQRTEYVLDTAKDSLAALAGIDFGWRIDDRLSITHDANAIAETDSSAETISNFSKTTVVLISGLEAKLTDRFSTQMSYNVDFDSRPQLGAEKMDTLSRITLMYRF